MTTTITVQCPDCLNLRHVELPYSYADFALRRIKWKSGTLIQVAFPELTVEQREAIQTGICDPCWTKMSESIAAPF